MNSKSQHLTLFRGGSYAAVDDSCGWARVRDGGRIGCLCPDAEWQLGQDGQRQDDGQEGRQDDGQDGQGQDDGQEGRQDGQDGQGQDDGQEGRQDGQEAVELSLGAPGTDDLPTLRGGESLICPVRTRRSHVDRRVAARV